MSLETLDTKIRAKARKSYEKQLEQWRQDTWRLLGVQPFKDIANELGSTNLKIVLSQVMDVMVKEAMASTAPRLEQDAVDAFMKDLADFKHRAVGEDEDF